MPTTTVAKWTISAGEAHGGGNKTALVGCHVASIWDDNGAHYQFQSPDGTAQATSTGTVLPTLPYSFDEFNAQLAGTADLSWYIVLESTTDGQNQNKAKGTWSNDPPGFADTDPDTWTAQSGGTGVDPEEDAASSAAYA